MTQEDKDILNKSQLLLLMVSDDTTQPEIEWYNESFRRYLVLKGYTVDRFRELATEHMIDLVFEDN
jgi:hypothetical protein